MALAFLEVAGGAPLCGEIEIQGSKNAVLPVLASCMLGDGLCVIENCPAIGDVDDLLRMMEMLGCSAVREGNTVRIDASAMEGYEIDGAEAGRIRSSILFLGPLLGKMGRAALPLPGGCAIGARPVDLHLETLRRLGAEFEVGDKILAWTGTLRGCRMVLSFPSVGATENAVLAAVLAEGETVIANAAQEPEIDELCSFLNLRGARIARREDGALQIRGVRRLKPVRYRMHADRIVAGTYLLAVAAAGGDVYIRNFPHGQLDAVLHVLREMGMSVYPEYRGCRKGMILSESVDREGGYSSGDGELCVCGCADSDPEIGRDCMGLRVCGRAKYPVPRVTTAPYPGFPTDLQSPLMAVLSGVKGRSCICEQIFESRFRTADELKKMGARILVDGNCAWIDGAPPLHGARLAAPDLRGGAALVIAALASRGRSVIGGTEYIERGYEDICRDLAGLGADIRMRDGVFSLV